jgi:ubiquinone/menaquinone biosynthesis C-methylase UbiE
MADSSGYLHGYSSSEQDRLYRQARFLEPRIFEDVDFSKERSIVEVGCGVGAQTEILLERFPHLKISGIDASREQLLRAEQRLKPAITAGRVNLTQGDALKLPYPDSAFDGAFICWFLEHVESPKEALDEVHRVLTPGGTVYCSEVLNATFYLHPYSPATQQYWFHFNDHQWNLKGDPFVGAKLGNLLLQTGFQNIRTSVKTFHYDNRMPKMRAQMIEEWTNLLLSGAPSMIQSGRVTPQLVADMTDELEKLKNDADAVFFYSFIQAKAQVF